MLTPFRGSLLGPQLVNASAPWAPPIHRDVPPAGSPRSRHFIAPVYQRVVLFMRPRTTKLAGCGRDVLMLYPGGREVRLPLPWSAPPAVHRKVLAGGTGPQQHRFSHLVTHPCPPQPDPRVSHSEA